LTFAVPRVYHKRRSKRTERWAKVFDVRGLATNSIIAKIPSLSVNYTAVVVTTNSTFAWDLDFEEIRSNSAEEI